MINTEQQKNDNLNTSWLINKVLNSSYNRSIWLITFLIWMVTTQNISDANCLTSCVASHSSPEGKTGCIHGAYFGHFVLQPIIIFFTLVVIKKVIIAIKRRI